MKKPSKRLKTLKEKITQESYPLDEAIKILKEGSTTKFEESFEVHIKLGIDMAKLSQPVRGTVVLPYSTGKKIRIACFTSPDKVQIAKEAGADVVGGADLVQEIKNTNKTNFDVAIATPDMMRLLGPVARILGTKGLMPNPKNETITTDPAKTIKELAKGKVSFKNDDSGNIHQMIGKTSLPVDQIKENVVAFVDAIRRARPDSAKGDYIKKITVSTTMGPGIKIKWS